MKKYIIILLIFIFVISICFGDTGILVKAFNRPQDPDNSNWEELADIDVRLDYFQDYWIFEGKWYSHTFKTGDNGGDYTSFGSIDTFFLKKIKFEVLKQNIELGSDKRLKFYRWGTDGELGKTKLEYSFSLFDQIWNLFNSFLSNIGISFRWLFSVADQKWEYFNLSGAEKSTEPFQEIKQDYFIESAVRNITFETVGKKWNDKDVDIYVGKSSTPTTSDYLKKSSSWNNSELISLNYPNAGKKYILMLYGYEAYNDVYLRVEKYFESNIWTFFAQFLKQYKIYSFIKNKGEIKEQLSIEIIYDNYPPYDENWYNEDWYTEGCTLKVTAPDIYEDSSGNKYDLDHWEKNTGEIITSFGNDSTIFINVNGAGNYYAVYNERKPVTLHGVDSTVEAIEPSEISSYADGYPSGEEAINGFPITMEFGDFQTIALTGESVEVPDLNGKLIIKNPGEVVKDVSDTIPGSDYKIRFAGWWDDKNNSGREFLISKGLIKPHYTVRLEREIRFDRHVNPDEVFPDEMNKLDAVSLTGIEIPSVTPWVPYSYKGVSLTAKDYISAPSDKITDGWKFVGWYLDNSISLGNALILNYAFDNFKPFKLSAHYYPTVYIEGIPTYDETERVSYYGIQVFSVPSNIKTVFTGISKIPVDYDSTKQINLVVNNIKQTNSNWNVTNSLADLPNVRFSFNSWDNGEVSVNISSEMEPVERKVYLDKEFKIQIEKTPDNVPITYETEWEKFGNSKNLSIPVDIIPEDSSTKCYLLKSFKIDGVEKYDDKKENFEVELTYITSPHLIEIEYTIYDKGLINKKKYKFKDPKRKFIFTP